MSVINGIWHKDGRPLDKEALLEQAAFGERYAPDGTLVCHAGVYGMSFQGFHTHERSSFEPGPREDSLGNMAVLDGRIDNGEELSQELGLSYDDTGDTALLLAAYQKWGEGCFNRIIGDWAIALWARDEHSLYLARDHAGTRTLYYSASDHSVTWSTYPESLIPLFSSSELCNDYAVRYLSCLPLEGFTPYKGIRTVLAGHYVRLDNSSYPRQKRYWLPELRERSECRSQGSYREEFLSLFRQAVKRRVDRSNNLICHLSGGMDSTAIVCLADVLTKEGALTDQVRTLSFYDPTEPNWDDHLYYTAVESHRGHRGVHIPNSRANRTFVESPSHYPLPGADSSFTEFESQVEEALAPMKTRCIIAGHGGDELLGGRPDPVPELADYLYGFQFGTFSAHTFQWARFLRKPFVSLACDALRLIWDLYPKPRRFHSQLAPWLREPHLKAAGTHKLKLWCTHTIGFRPTELDKEDTWENLADSLPHLFHQARVRHEYRYPFLDRSLVEFLFTVPQSQLRQPGRRRYLMRGALRGIVPHVVLERRRKAFVSRGPLIALQRNRQRIEALIRDCHLHVTGLLDARALQLDFVNIVQGGPSSSLLPMMRAIELELWLKAHGGGRGLTVN